MASESKKRKADCTTHNRKNRFTDLKSLKWKNKGKGFVFYNSAQRQKNKEIDIGVEEC